jgi:hypothetical protein
MKNPYKLQLKREGLEYRPILGHASAKTIKGEKIGYLTAICYLVPDVKLCPFAMQPVQYWPELNTTGTAQYDPSIPLFEILPDAEV